MNTYIIKRGYDQIAHAYFASRDKLKSGKYVRQLLKYLPKHASVLDLGCGAGVPVDDLLLKEGHSVVGIDISPEQIKLARNNCKMGNYMARDMCDLREREFSVDCVVAFYSIFHIPRGRQGSLFKTIASYLPTGGMLLVTMGDREFEGKHQLEGVTLWSSQYGTKKNRSMVERAGFNIIMDEIDTSGGERHQVILAKKR